MSDVEKVAQPIYDAYLAGFAAAHGVECIADVADGGAYHKAHVGAQGYVAALSTPVTDELVKALKGLVHEFEKFSRYGSPIAMEANEAMQRARQALSKYKGVSS